MGFQIDQLQITLILLALCLIALVRVLKVAITRSHIKAVSAVRRMLAVSGEGISIGKPVDAELGRLHTSVWQGRRRYTSVKFSSFKEVVLSTITYEDLCSGGYLLAVGPNRTGYLEVPAMRISSGLYKNVLILCMDPNKVPRVAKSIEVSEDSSTAKALVEVLDGRYLARVSWVSHELPSWRLVYDPQRKMHRIVKEPGERSRARSLRVEICVRSPEYPTSEVCSVIAKIAKVGSEESGALEGLTNRKIVVIHKDKLDLLELAKELEVSRYPHISGYSEGCVRVKVILDIPSAMDIKREELI